MEKSEARQYLQLVQYCAKCNRGVMPVPPVNTVPNIGILLAYYWCRTIFTTFNLSISDIIHSKCIFINNFIIPPDKIQSVSATRTGPVLLSSTSPVLTANSQPSYHLGSSQYCTSTRNPTVVLAWYRASSKFPPRRSKYN